MDPSDDLDGVVAAPQHHRVIFENDRVRVVETSGSHFVRRDPSGVELRGQ